MRSADSSTSPSASSRFLPTSIARSAESSLRRSEIRSAPGLEEARRGPATAWPPRSGANALAHADRVGTSAAVAVDEPADQDVRVDRRALLDLRAGQARSWPQMIEPWRCAEERLELGQPGVEGRVDLVALGGEGA